VDREYVRGVDEMKLRIFEGEFPSQKDLNVPHDTRVIVLNSKSDIDIMYDTKHGVVDENDEPVVLYG